MARILIIRFSALGDVAMTIPVIHSLAVQYPQHEITVLSRAVWQPLFQGLPTNVGFVGADLTGKHTSGNDCLLIDGFPSQLFDKQMITFPGAELINQFHSGSFKRGYIFSLLPSDSSGMAYFVPKAFKGILLVECQRNIFAYGSYCSL